ncbi:MAG TPA: hypothetical protein VMT69_09865 [Kineosporiaceae bacterium]|nr:hypothetical protein [Kineosporiaceae bacterium]
MMKSEHCGEWTAAPLRVTARWVPVCGPAGRTHMEMVWSIPDVDMSALAAADRAEDATRTAPAA